MEPWRHMRALGLIARGLRRRRGGRPGGFARAQLMDSIADAVLVLDGERRLVDLNVSAFRLAGKPAEWRGQPADVFFPFLAGATIAGAGAPPESTVAAGAKVYDVRVSRARADRAVWIVMLRDVSEARRAAAEREAFVIQHNELVARVTHELRTPVATIRGALELVLARAASALDRDSQRLLQTAMQGCERLARIVHEILDLSTIDAERAAGTVQALAVERLFVDALLDLGQAAAAKGIRLTTSVEQGLPTVRGDHDRLVQVLVQLVSSAIARGPAGSVVTLSARRARGRGGPSVAVGVRDDGPGISAAQIETTLRSPALAVVKALVEQQSGDLAIESPSAVGATFVVYLRAAPLPVASGPADEAETPRRATASTRSARILVADDDADLRDVVTEALRAQGFEVVEAADGREATEVLERDPLDLAVLDITMPHQNGYEVIRRLRAGTRQPHLPVLVLTGTIDERETPASLGANALLTKPANLKRLIGEVKALLGSPSG